MIVAIADTHAAIWYLFSDPRVGSKASAFIDSAIANGDQSRPALSDLHAAAADPKAVLQHVPLDQNIGRLPSRHTGSS
jgi:hypothetical protein